MSDNPIIYTKDNHPSTPKEFMIDIFGEDMNMWPTIEELVESARANASQTQQARTAYWVEDNHYRIVAKNWEPGDILFCYWEGSRAPHLGNYWLLYVAGAEALKKGYKWRRGAFLVTFPYPKSWTVDGDSVEFWYSFDKNGEEWYSNKFYGMINIDELKGLDKFSMFINWISNPSEVKE